MVPMVPHTYPADTYGGYLCKKSATGPGGYFPWKGLQGCVAVKTPFSHSLSRSSTRTPFQHIFRSTRPYINQKSHNISNLRFKIPNFGKFSVPNPNVWSKSSSESLNLGQKSVLEAAFGQKNQFNKPQIWRRSVLQAPIFSPTGPSPIPKPKLSTPGAQGVLKVQLGFSLLVPPFKYHI